jgi:hypothetical protein
MLLTKTVILKWNSKVCKHYINLGYQYTHIGDEFEVKVEDLTNGSTAKVVCKCEYCGNDFDIIWRSYLKLKKKTNNKDCCGKKECTTIKAQESVKMLYGVDFTRRIPGVDEKIKQTNIEKYGCENPFGNKEIQNKIKQYYIDNFGVTSNSQIKECRDKYKNTCIEKYGCENYSQTKMFRESMRGKNNPKWKGDFATTIRDGRELPEYRDWRKAVFLKDRYTCKCCGARNGNGKFVRLEAHHMFNWKDNLALRYDVHNGITLCQNCHIKFHQRYGKRNNTNIQLFWFIKCFNKDKKIC